MNITVVTVALMTMITVKGINENVDSCFLQMFAMFQIGNFIFKDKDFFFGLFWNFYLIFFSISIHLKFSFHGIVISYNFIIRVEHLNQVDSDLAQA